MTRLFKASGWVVQIAGMAAIVDGLWRVSVPGALVLAGIMAVVTVELVDRGVR